MGAMARLVRQLLAEAGWQLLRTGKGDHEIWWNPETGARVVVDDGMTNRHTANAVLKQAGLPKRF